MSTARRATTFGSPVGAGDDHVGGIGAPPAYENSSTAIEGRALGIRANAVAPGAIDTQLLRSSPNIASGKEQVPEGMLGRPEDIASVVAFLASADAAFMTGSVVTADGGRMALL